VPFLILSDIHANLEALEAVLADAQGRYDAILCLGDLVGYGADPNAVVEWARQNARAVVRGNHDKAGAGEEPLYIYNPAARAALAWTQAQLTAASRAYLQGMPRGPLRVTAEGRAAERSGYDRGFDLAHGSPVDEDEYLISAIDVALLRPELEARLTFFGHTHIQGGFWLTHSAVTRIATEWVLQMEPDYFYLVNPGSVGQPRDHDPRAAYVLFDPLTRTVEYRRTRYDVERAAGKIIAAGLPETLAARLFEGV
jgi:predicted phosphodiesterase